MPKTNEQIKTDLNQIMQLTTQVKDESLGSTWTLDQNRIGVAHLFLMDRIATALQDIHDLLDSKLP